MQNRDADFAAALAMYSPLVYSSPPPPSPSARPGRPTARACRAGRGHLAPRAYTFDGTAQRQVLYLDGGQVASSATTLAAGYDTQSLYLGRDTENGAPNYFLQGSLDEAAVYSRP